MGLTSKQVKVYQTANASIMQVYADEIREHVFTAFATSEEDGSFSIADDGSLAFARTSPVGSGTKLTSESEASKYLSKALGAADKAVSRDSALTDAGVPRLLTDRITVDEMSFEAADGSYTSWEFKLGIWLKARSGRDAVVAGASVTATISASGEITAFASYWRPVVAAEKVTLYPLFVASDASDSNRSIVYSEDSTQSATENSDEQVIELRYLFTASENLIVPVYAFVGGDRDGELLPACDYAVSSLGY